MKIDKDEFLEWLDTPITEYVIKYLTDSAKEMSEIVSNDILNGSILSESEQIRAAVTCATLQRISEIDLEEIESFYNQET